jgi:signal transduction histidine kinase
MRRWGWRNEAILTIAVAALQIAGTTGAARHQSDVRSLDAGGYLLLGAAVAVLPARRRWPVATMAATFLLTLGYSLAGYPNGPIWAPLIIAFGTALVAGHRRAAYATLLAGYAGFEWLVPAVTGNDWPSAASAIGLAAWLLLILAISEVVRFRLAYRSESRRRAVEEERTRIEEARRQASEQRLGIARELHDVLAHSISLINVQAGVALELMDQRPDAARNALASIKQTSKDALIEVQSVLAALRQSDEPAPHAPTPTLGDLAGLLDNAEATGLETHLQTTGTPSPVPVAVEQAAYRIVQEAVTNVVRHADATTVMVQVTYLPDELELTVEDDGRGPSTSVSNGGYGISGMRERASALGGQLSAEPRADRGFCVSVRLPLNTDVTS